MRKTFSVIATLALVTSVGITTPAASSALGAPTPLSGPKAPAVPSIEGTAGEVLQEIPVVEPLTVGYKAGLFQPVGTMTKKDKRGCTTRNQLLIKMASKKPKVGKKCKLTGGEWLVDFGARTVKKPSQVKLTTLLPDKYVYAQGAYGWDESQRRAYRSNYAPGKTTATRSSVVPWTPATIQAFTASPFAIVEASHAIAIRDTSDEKVKQAELKLEQLKAKNPEFWNNLTAATILNAKSWGLSLDPTMYGDFEVTIAECSQADEKKGEVNPCTTVYSVTNEAVRYNIQAVPMSASIRPPAATTGPAGSTQPDLAYGTATGPVITSSLFGIHSPAHWVSDIASGIERDIEADTIASVPAGYVRLWDTETTWADLEPTKGSFEWRTFDKQVQVAERKGAKVLMVLGGTPSWASAAQTPQAMPSSVAEWRDYVRAVSCRNAGKIDAYEIWNEANLQTFWTGTPEQMAELTAAAKEEIAGCDPSATVVAASTTTRATGSFGTFYPAYLNALKAKGWPIGAYSVHSYPRASGGADARIAGIGQFKAMLALAGAPTRPIFDTEVNYGLAGLGEGRVARSGAEAMSLLSRTFIDSARYGFESTFWFVWTTAATAQLEEKFGITLTPNSGNEQQAWRTTYDWLVGAQFQRCLELENNITVCQFNKGAENFSLVWHGDVGSGFVESKPGQLARLGSRSCNLYGQCENLTANSSVTVSPMPMRVDGTPLVTGASDTNRAPAAPLVTDPTVEYVGNADALFKVSINPDPESAIQVDGYEIVISECKTETGNDCRTLSEETITSSPSLRYSVPLGSDVSGFVQATVRAINTAGSSPTADSARTRVGIKSAQAVTGFGADVARNKTIGVHWDFIPPRPGVDMSYVITLETKPGRDFPIDAYIPVFQTTVEPQFSGASIAWEDITGPRGAKLFSEGDLFKACVKMKTQFGEGPQTCQVGEFTTKLPTINRSVLVVDRDYTQITADSLLGEDNEGFRNVRGFELQYVSGKTGTWQPFPTAVPGVNSSFIPLDSSPRNRNRISVSIQSGLMDDSKPRAFRIRTVSQPGESGGPWLGLNPDGQRTFTGVAPKR